MSEIKYPNITVELIDQDGNAFNLIGITAKAIRQNVGNDAAKEFLDEAMSMGSYDLLLAYIGRTVHVI